MKKNNLEKETFIFESYSFDKDTKTLLLRYSFGGSEEFSFVEKIEFPSEKKLTEEELLALDCVFKYLHLACGVSYYKLFIPRNIEVKTFDLGEAEAKFFNDFYLNGLGEFSYRNNARDLEKRIKFPFTKNVKNRAIGIALAPKMAVAIGGGKDSVTSVEILRRRFDVKLMSVNTASPIDGTIEASGLDFFHPKRTISKNLLELNKRIEEIGGFNGHIPISGILVFISAAASIIYDFNVIIFSNERSANTGNVEFCGRMINHQWSKSFEFEKKFNGFCQKFILKNFKYISFLRPLSELHIAKLFSQSDEKYHKIFTSCNRVFKIENPASNWCGDCDKCRFVFLILSVFFKKEKLVNIFGKNLLDDETQLPGYRELCGLEKFKPFECVGEIEESVYAALKTGEDFKNDYIIRKIREELPPTDVKKLEKKIFRVNKRNHSLGRELFAVLEEACERWGDGAQASRGKKS